MSYSLFDNEGNEVARIWMNNGQLHVRAPGIPIVMDSASVCPVGNKAQDLGQNDYQWECVYTPQVRTDGDLQLTAGAGKHVKFGDRETITTEVLKEFIKIKCNGGAVIKLAIVE